MFVLNLVFLALLVISRSQSGIPQYIEGQWVLADDSRQYDDVDEQPLAEEERTLTTSPPEVTELVTVEDQNLPTSTEPPLMKEQVTSKEAEESAVWKIVLVAAVLLVSVVGSLSTAYYLCIWRGGRFHYRPQKEDYA